MGEGFHVPTPAAVSKRAGVSNRYLSEVENGSRNISLENILALAKALGVKPAKLFNW
jgi:transcriptional regulator with XRE-family HTH domain